MPSKSTYKYNVYSQMRNDFISLVFCYFDNYFQTNLSLPRAEPNVPNMRPLDGMKRARMRNMLEQHALRLKRGGYNSGFAHALRVRRGGIDERSSWGHALRVRSSNMLNRGHALRIKRKPGDYRSFALRVRKDDSSMRDLLDKSLEDQGIIGNECLILVA